MCPGPYYVIGHSTGGSIVLRALTKRNWFARAVVTSPLVGLRYGGWPLPVVHVLVFLATHLGLGWMFLPGQRQKPLGREDFPDNPLTSDAVRWGRDSGTLEATPKLGTGAPTFSWLRAAMKSTRMLKRMRASTHLQSPLLIVAAGLDRVVDNEAIRRFAKRCRAFPWSGCASRSTKSSPRRTTSAASSSRRSGRSWGTNCRSARRPG